MAGSKNLGQVAGLFIGTTPPSNTALIWYDNTPSMQCHKVWSVPLNQWVVLDNVTILAVEYSVLRNEAQTVGLSAGQWFKITDKNNALALAITSTKVQYVDTMGNMLIDDLGASVQYLVTHQNILIDDVRGVWDVENERLVFEFSTVSALNALGEDYFLGKRKVDNVWTLFKMKIESLLSRDSSNAITWSNGFYLNFTQRFISMLDVPGGGVSKSRFDNVINSILTNLSNVASNQQAIAQQAAQAVANATTDAQIYNKRLPAAPSPGAPNDILQNDTLQTIITNIQRWFNVLRYATGVRMSSSYAKNSNPNLHVNPNDTVETAIGKIDAFVTGLTNNAKLPDDWQPKPTSSTIADVAAGNSIAEAFSRLVGRLNQLGKITLNKLVSNILNGDDEPLVELNLGSALFYLRRANDNFVRLFSEAQSSGIDIRTNGSNTSISDHIYHQAASPQLEEYGNFNGVQYGVDSCIYTKGDASSPRTLSASLVLKNKRIGGRNLDLLCQNAAIGGINVGLEHRNFDSDEVLGSNISFVSIGARGVILPPNADCFKGKIIFASSILSSGNTPEASGKFFANNGQVIKIPVFRWYYAEDGGYANQCIDFHQFIYSLSVNPWKGLLHMLVYTGEQWSGEIDGTSYSDLYVWEFYSCAGGIFDDLKVHPISS